MREFSLRSKAMSAGRFSPPVGFSGYEIPGFLANGHLPSGRLQRCCGLTHPFDDLSDVSPVQPAFGREVRQMAALDPQGFATAIQLMVTARVLTERQIVPRSNRRPSSSLPYERFLERSSRS